MARPPKPPDAPIQPYGFIAESDWDSIFDFVSKNGSLSAALRHVLGPDKAPRAHSTAYAALRNRPLDLGVRLESSQQSFRDLLTGELVRRGVFGVDKARTWKGEVVGYDKEYSDAALLAACRHYLGAHGWVDKRSVSDTTIHSSGDAEPGIWSISADEALSLPPDLRRSLIDVLEHLKAKRAQLATALPAIEHDGANDTVDEFAMTPRQIEGDWR